MSEPKNKPEPETNNISEFERDADHHDWWQDILDIFKEADFTPAQVYVRDTDDASWREVDISDKEPELAPETPTGDNEVKE